MSFCPQCGAPSQPGMTFCTACGANLPAAPAVAPPPAAPMAAGLSPLAPAPPPPTRPMGKQVASWKTIVFPFITVGLYPYFFWWRIGREIDAYAESRSSPLVRAGVLVTVLGLVGTIIASFQIVYPVFAEIMEAAATGAEAPTTTPDLTSEYLASPLYLGATGVSVAGSVLLWLGLHRVWSALAADEARRGIADRVNPNLYVGFLAAGVILQIVALFVPALGILSFAAFIATLWIMYTTQQHLNATWIANGAPPAV